jgi:fructose-1,6-bisphosphatase
MNRSAVTLGRHIIEDEHRDHNTTGELSRLLVQIGFAAKIIAREVGRAALWASSDWLGKRTQPAMLRRSSMSLPMKP